MFASHLDKSKSMSGVSCDLNDVLCFTDQWAVTLLLYNRVLLAICVEYPVAISLQDFSYSIPFQV